MIVIEPLGQEEGRYPHWRTPIIVPKRPVLPAFPEPEGKGLFWFYALIGGVILAATYAGSSGAELGYFVTPREKRRGKKLMHFWKYYWRGGKPTVIGKTKVDYFKQRAGQQGDLYAVYAYSADHGREMIEKGEAEVYGIRIKERAVHREPERMQPAKPEQLPLFSGPIMNCGVWQEIYSPHIGKITSRCLKFAPACAPPSCVTDPAADAARKMKVCVKTKKVFSSHYAKLVHRCAKFGPVCTRRACLPEPIPAPEPEPEPEIPESEVKALAKALAYEYNVMQQEAGPALAREILSRGGIAPYKRGYLKEEYKEIPLHLRHKRGLPLDEMASEMGVDEATLMTMIKKAYPKGRKVERRKPWKEFVEAARDRLLTEYRQGLRGIGHRQPEMFKLKRQLVLTPENAATSEDPLDICLERVGWKIDRVRELQASIAAKMTPDLFTGKKGKLTGGERMLQEQIDQCLKRIAAGRIGQIQPEFPLTIRAPRASDPIAPELEPLAVFARKYDPKRYVPQSVVDTLRERYRKLHHILAMPQRVKGKYPKPLETLLASHYGYASGDPKRSIQAFWYHAHGYAPDGGPLPEVLLYRKGSRTVSGLGRLQPWEMTRKEWSIARDEAKTEYAHQKATRASAAEAIRSVAELQRLNYGAEMWDDVLEAFTTDHIDVAAKAVREGKKIPPQALKDYPGIYNYVKSRDYLRRLRRTTEIKAALEKQKEEAVKWQQERLKSKQRTV